MDTKSERMKLVGEIFLELFDDTGRLKDSRYVRNLVTSAGFDLVSNYLGQASPRPAAANFLAIGSGTTAAVIGDTALQFELPNSRLSGTYTHTNGTLTYTQVTTFPPGTGTGGVTEAGMLNASAAGTLWNHQVFAVVNKAAADSLSLTFTVTLS